MDKSDRSKREADVASDSSNAWLELIVAMLEARKNSNDFRDQLLPHILRYADPFGVWRRLLDKVSAQDIRDLAFDLARLQVDALKQSTEIGQKFSELIGARLKTQREASRAAAQAAPQPRELVCHLGGEGREGSYTGTLKIPALGGEAFTLPDALHIRPIDAKSGFPVNVEFEPREIRPGATEVSVTVPADPWLEEGERYQAMLPIGTESPIVVYFRLEGRKPR